MRGFESLLPSQSEHSRRLRSARPPPTTDRFGKLPKNLSGASARTSVCAGNRFLEFSANAPPFFKEHLISIDLYLINVYHFHTILKMMGKESPHDRFARLATKRTNAVLEKLRVLGNCANRSIYNYSDDEIDKIFGTIARELQDVKAKFKRKRSNQFSL